MPRLRIGYLTYALDRPLTGVTRVALELGKALRATGECDLVYLTTYRHGPFADDGSTSQYLAGCSLLPGLMTLGGPQIAVAARRHHLDLVHDPMGICPFPPLPGSRSFARVVTLYDAIAFHYPEGYPWFNNFLHRRYIPAMVRNADRIFIGSAHARDDLRQFLGLASDQFDVVPFGVSSAFRPVPAVEAHAVAARYGLTGPYVLTIGAPQPRKNLVRLVEAFALARQQAPGLRLAIAGPNLWHYEGIAQQIRALGLGDSVAMLGYVPDADLPALYSAAQLFAFPSLYEGFGLPVIEAMACGTPVVCSNASSIPEVAGDAAVLVGPTDVGAIADAMLRIVQDPALGASLRQRGTAQAAHFTWQQAARQTLDGYQRVLDRRRTANGSLTVRRTP